MTYSRIRILTGALLLGLGAWGGSQQKIATQPVLPTPHAPRDTPRRKKKANGKTGGAKDSLWSRMSTYWRQRGTNGGGAQERARRVRQIERGIINASSGLQRASVDHLQPAGRDL